MEPGLESRLNVPENEKSGQGQLELPAWKQELRGYLPVQTLFGAGALCNVILSEESWVSHPSFSNQIAKCTTNKVTSQIAIAIQHSYLQLVTDQHWGWRITCTSHQWHRELPDDPKSEVRNESQAGQKLRVATKQQGPYLYLVTDQH